MTTAQTILCTDCSTLQEPFWAHILTDPPYRPHVHSKAVTCSNVRGVSKRDLGFAPLGDPLRTYLVRAVEQTPGWSVLYSDVEDSHLLREPLAPAYIRTLAWVRWSMPQLSADRPTQGFEHILLFHGPGPKRWFGPGYMCALEHDGEPCGAVDHSCLRGAGKHQTEKPLDQALDLVHWFTRPGECVYDPCAGRGTLGQACRLLGREYVGCELDQVEAELAKARLTSPLSKRDLDRVDRWVTATTERLAHPGQGVQADRSKAAIHTDQEHLCTALSLIGSV